MDIHDLLDKIQTNTHKYAYCAQKTKCTKKISPKPHKI